MADQETDNLLQELGNSLPPSPEIPELEPLVSSPQGEMRTCRHCGGLYAKELPVCPGCGKSQRGRVSGATVAPPAANQSTENMVTDASPSAPVTPARKKRGKEPPTEKEMLMAEEAIGQVFTFACEDIIAPRMLPKGVEPPPFGKERADRIGIILAPVVAPLLRGPYILALLALVVCAHAVMSYFREVRRLAADNGGKPTAPRERAPPQGVQSPQGNKVEPAPGVFTT